MGLVRRIDSLGRVVLPKDFRKELLIKQGDLLEISLFNNESIIIKKSQILGFNNIYLDIIIKLVSKKIDGDIHIINSNIIVYSTNVENIGKKAGYIIDNNKEKQYYKSINVNGDNYGQIVFEIKKHNLEIKIEYIDFLYDFICDCLEM